MPTRNGTPISGLRFRILDRRRLTRSKIIAPTSLVIAGKPDLGPSKQEMRRADLGPNQHKMTTMVVAHEMWEKILKPAIIKRAGTFYVFGEITYFDAFQDRSCDVPHFTRYRFEISPDDEGITD